jgi:hypothetical protein
MVYKNYVSEPGVAVPHLELELEIRSGEN